MENGTISGAFESSEIGEVRSTRYQNAFAVTAGNVPVESVEELRAYFPYVVLLPRDKRLAEPVAHHPDMIFSVVGDTLVTHRSYYEGEGKCAVDEICALSGFRLIVSDMDRGADYPRDVGFNAAILSAKGVLMGKCVALAPELLTLAEKAGLETVDVKQGYAACSTLILWDGELVCTADRGILAACEALGVDTVPLSEKNGILIPGYDCGFIGGSAGVWKRTVFFFGDPRLHPALAPLCDALAERGFSIVPLSDSLLTDYGGIKILPLR